MPYADKNAARMASRERQRRYRARQRAKRNAPVVAVPAPVPADPIGALAQWSRETLRVPPGHPLAGQPLALPDYGESFLRDALGARESLLCLGRKNAKSAIVAVFLLGRLVGPIRIDGYRAGVASVSKEKAGELKRQMQEIAEASKLARAAVPCAHRHRAESKSATGTVDILSCRQVAQGHASADSTRSIIDEIGLALMNAIVPVHQRNENGYLSARDGRFIALSIHGDAPFTAEMIERRADPGCAVHLYRRAGRIAALDDPAAWHAANPGAGVRHQDRISYMQRRSLGASCLSVRPTKPAFAPTISIMPQSPLTREMILRAKSDSEVIASSSQLAESAAATW